MRLSIVPLAYRRSATRQETGVFSLAAYGFAIDATRRRRAQGPFTPAVQARRETDPPGHPSVKGQRRLRDLGSGQLVVLDRPGRDGVVLEFLRADGASVELARDDRVLLQLLHTDAVPRQLDRRIARAAKRDRERDACDDHGRGRQSTQELAPEAPSSVVRRAIRLTLPPTTRKGLDLYGFLTAVLSPTAGRRRGR